MRNFLNAPLDEYFHQHRPCHIPSCAAHHCMCNIVCCLTSHHLYLLPSWPLDLQPRVFQKLDVCSPTVISPISHQCCVSSPSVHCLPLFSLIRYLEHSYSRCFSLHGCCSCNACLFLTSQVPHVQTSCGFRPLPLDIANTLTQCSQHLFPPFMVALFALVTTLERIACNVEGEENDSRSRYPNLV